MLRLTTTSIVFCLFVQLFTANAFGQATGFTLVGDIPAAQPGTIDGYYDIGTGDVLISVGSDVLLFGIPFGPVSLLEDTFSENVGLFEVSLLNTQSAFGPPQQNDAGGLGWVNFSGFPPGVHNLGPMLDAFPNGSIDASSQAEFDAALAFSYGNYSPEISYIDQIAGNPPVRRTFSIVVPEFSPAAVPEPTSSAMLLLGSLGLCGLRHRKS